MLEKFSNCFFSGYLHVKIRENLVAYVHVKSINSEGYRVNNLRKTPEKSIEISNLNIYKTAIDIRDIFIEYHLHSKYLNKNNYVLCT